MSTTAAHVLGLTAAGLLLAGCGSMPDIRFTRYGAPAPQPAGKSPPAPPPQVSQGIPIANEWVATPSVRKVYYVGQLIDPAHPELMYRPGIVVREEVPERWNRNPIARRGTISGTLAAVPDPAVLPPSSPELEQMIAQQRKVMELLADSNAELAQRLSGSIPETGAESEPSPATASTGIESGSPAFLSNPPAVFSGRVDLGRALVPNADGAIELSPEILDEIDRSEPNPFVKRFQSQLSFREIVVTVTGTSLGPRPTASINGRLVNVGDQWEGFGVAAITRDAVYLQKELFLLQIPLARSAGITVRLPN